ncbi:MAG: hypothetical protein MRJ68_16290 [Nitrospira sp.]|nr:hypothetical protein [Nitrospira sp.]
MPQPIAHVHAWRRHTVGEVKRMWNEGLFLREICDRLHISEASADHILRGSIGASIGPPVKPRRSYGSFQRRQLRDLYEVPG